MKNRLEINNVDIEKLEENWEENIMEREEGK